MKLDGLRLSGLLRPHRLAGQAALLLLAVGIVQVVASTLFYEAIDRQSIREDHARRVAEFLVVSERLHRLDPGSMADVMTTSHLTARAAAMPVISRQGRGEEVSQIRSHIVKWEPALARHSLVLDIHQGVRGRKDLVGSMRLDAGTWLNFRSNDISSGWPIALRATVMTLMITLACIAAGFLTLRYLMRPLRQLAEAAEATAGGMPVAVRESGPLDLRNLARSFNDMQTRISGLETEHSRSFEAISHDLRTPLSRLKIASDFVGEGDIARIVSSSADEMESMLLSLQSFLRAQHLSSTAEPVDLVGLIRELLVHVERPVTLEAPSQAVAFTYREPLRLALQPLVQNALQYGHEIAIAITSPRRDKWRIRIADDGPGIPDEAFERILDPFCRLDDARPRDTPGFGLGIPTAHRLLERFGGKLTFENGEGGGLIVQVEVPPAQPGGS